MRAKTLTTLLLAALTTAAHAKPLHRSAPKPQHAVKSRHVGAAPARAHGGKASLARVKAGKSRPANAHSAKTHLEKASARHARHEKPLTRAELRRAKAEVRYNPRRHAVVEEPIAEAPAPAPAQPAPEVHVTHNRKRHLKAAPADFLMVTPAGGNVPTAAVAPAVPIVRRTVVAAAPATAHEEAIEPVVLPVLYRRGRLVMPPAMKGSHEILVHQNVMANQDGLERVQDDEDLNRMRESKSLVGFPQTPGLVTDERLPVNRRYTRPWTAQFLATIARAHYAQFHTALQVNSAVRTVEFQTRLIRTNGNAAPADGENASPHLTGQAIDLAKKGWSMTEIAWMRGYLMPLVQEGKIDVEEEFQQACFHISVYRKYMPQAAPRRNIADHQGTGVSLATGVLQ